MTTPEAPNLYEPTQEELKTTYDDLYKAIKAPGPRHIVKVNPDIGKVRHEVILSQIDAVEITKDPTAKNIITHTKDITHTFGSGESSIYIEIGLGEPSSPLQITQIYYLEKVPTINPLGKDKYYLDKTFPVIEDTSQPLIFIDASDQQPDLEATSSAEDNDEDSIDEMGKDVRRITPDDMAMLGRLTMVLNN